MYVYDPGPNYTLVWQDTSENGAPACAPKPLYRKLQTGDDGTGLQTFTDLVYNTDAQNNPLAMIGMKEN